MDTELRLKLALRIRELRKKHKYTQEKLSELANLDAKHIQLLESKRPCAPTLDTLEKLAKVFKMSISKLLDFK